MGINMKKLEFETSKGRFVIVDSTTLDKVSGQALVDEYGDYIILSEITEEQASEIVFRIGHHSNDHLIPSAKQILHSLLKSKGIYLFENPYGEWFSDFKNANDELDWQLAEQKTFYNPYIFKL